MLASGLDFRVPSDAADIPKLLQFGFTTLQSVNQAKYKWGDPQYQSEPRPWPVFQGPVTVGVMFAPSGRLHAVWVNGETIDDSIWFSKVMRRAGLTLWVDVPLTLEIGHTGFTTHYVPRKAG